MTLDPSGETTIELNTHVYRLVAIKKAAYKFGDRCHIAIDLKDGHRACIRLTMKTANVDVAFFAGEFRNEVLDQELREQLSEETQPIRNLLLAQAFSETSLIEPVTETADYADDPLGIERTAQVHNMPNATADDVNRDARASYPQ